MESGDASRRMSAPSKAARTLSRRGSDQAGHRASAPEQVDQCKCEELFEWIVRDLGNLGVDVNSLRGFYSGSLTAAPSLLTDSSN